MKLLRGLLLSWALCLFAQGALAATDVRDCAAIPGSLVGVNGGTCYWLKINPDGSLSTTAAAGSGAGTPTDDGGTITLGGTAQTAIAANSLRRSAVCQNPTSATEDLFISITASAPSVTGNNYAGLIPGGSATIEGTTAVKVIAATTGHRFYCTEWQ